MNPSNEGKPQNFCLGRVSPQRSKRATALVQMEKLRQEGGAVIGVRLHRWSRVLIITG